MFLDFVAADNLWLDELKQDLAHALGADEELARFAERKTIYLGDLEKQGYRCSTDPKANIDAQS
ncbi:MAG: hypothetical protein AAF352_01135 [Pseudomonadota bacterium]